MKIDPKRLFIGAFLLMAIAGCRGGTGPPAGETPPESAPLIATSVAQTVAVLAPGTNGGVAAQTSPTAPQSATSVGSVPGRQQTNPIAATVQPTATLTATAILTSSAAPSSKAAPTSTAVPISTAAPISTATLAPTVLSATSTPAIAPSATPTNVQAEVCIDKAGFFGDLTIPDDTLVKMNEDFAKTWRVRNEGTCTWNGYQLVFAGGSILNGPPAAPLPKAAPGDIVEISVDLKAPAQGGKYISDWEFQNTTGKRFGVNSAGQDYIWTRIQVDWGPGGNPTPPPPTCTYQETPATIAQLLVLINTARTSQGLKPLALQSQLSAAAMVHSVDMACNNFIDHTGSDGSSWYSRIKAKGYAYSYASENIYVGDPAFGGDAQGAFTWWMNSQVHRDNILSTKVTQIGIGFAYFSGSKFGGYYTLDFTRP